MIVIATIYRKLGIVKNFFRRLSKKHLLRTPFDSQDIKGCQTFGKEA